MCPGIRCLTLRDLLSVDYREPRSWFLSALAARRIKFYELYSVFPSSVIIHPEMHYHLLKMIYPRPIITYQQQNNKSGIAYVMGLKIIPNHNLVQENEFILTSSMNGVLPDAND